MLSNYTEGVLFWKCLAPTSSAFLFSTVGSTNSRHYFRRCSIEQLSLSSTTARWPCSFFRGVFEGEMFRMVDCNNIIAGHISSSLGSEAAYTALYLHVSFNGMISNLTSSACAKLKRSLPMDPFYNENEYRCLRLDSDASHNVYKVAPPPGQNNVRNWRTDWKLDRSNQNFILSRACGPYGLVGNKGVPAEPLNLMSPVFPQNSLEGPDKCRSYHQQSHIIMEEEMSLFL